jgi:hypothetical protein
MEEVGGDTCSLEARRGGQGGLDKEAKAGFDGDAYAGLVREAKAGLTGMRRQA